MTFRRSMFVLVVSSALASSACDESSAPADLCPDDPNKLESLVCGCGVSDADGNENGVPDCLDAGIDLCPDDANKTLPATCGCGTSDADANENGVPDCLDAAIDLCPDDANKTQAGTCGCGVSDADVAANGVPDCLEVKAIFVTTVSNGNLGGLTGADAICNASAGRPYAGSTWKAMLAGSGRSACATAGCNWVLRPGQTYVRADSAVRSAATVIGKTDSNARFSFPLTASIGAPHEVYTGLTGNWSSSTFNCSNWTSGDAAVWGSEGHSEDTGATALNAYEQFCNRAAEIYCVEQ